METANLMVEVKDLEKAVEIMLDKGFIRIPVRHMPVSTEDKLSVFLNHHVGFICVIIVLVLLMVFGFIYFYIGALGKIGG